MLYFPLCQNECFSTCNLTFLQTKPIHFNMRNFEWELILEQRQKTTWKRLIKLTVLKLMAYFTHFYWQYLQDHWMLKINYWTFVSYLVSYCNLKSFMNPGLLSLNCAPVSPVSVINIWEISILSRVRTGPGKPGKAWNFIMAFSRTGKPWKKATGPGKFWKSVKLN